MKQKISFLLLAVLFVFALPNTASAWKITIKGENFDICICGGEDEPRPCCTKGSISQPFDNMNDPIVIKINNRLIEFEHMELVLDKSMLTGTATIGSKTAKTGSKGEKMPNATEIRNGINPDQIIFLNQKTGESISFKTYLNILGKCKNG